jgi:hypothetical protein
MQKHTMGSALRGGWHPLPNQAVEPTRNSLRSSLAPAIARGSPRALGVHAEESRLRSRR